MTRPTRIQNATVQYQDNSDLDSLIGSATASEDESDGSEFEIEQIDDFASEDAPRRRYNYHSVSTNNDNGNSRQNKIPFINQNEPQDINETTLNFSCPFTNLPKCGVAECFSLLFNKYISGKLF